MDDLTTEAMDLLRASQAALARVRSLHAPVCGEIDPACAACGTADEYAVPWPCPTIRAIDTTEEHR